MKHLHRLLASVGVGLGWVAFVSSPAGAAAARPKLVLVVVIDQFRADTITRFEKRLLPPRAPNGDVGGFRYLMGQGAFYPYAQYEISHSMTGPGHATILSGSYPYTNGIGINYWFDSDTEKKIYCVGDPESSIVFSIPPAAKPGEPAPLGMSPRNFAGSTVGDELKNSGHRSRVVSLSLKDRAAILMGGPRADLALWFDTTAQQWVTSRFYAPDGKLPPWVAHLNSQIHDHKGDTIPWDAPGGAGSGLTTEKSFPHAAPFGSRNALAGPHGLEITATAAERALDAYKLGRNPTGATDVLAVSFSSHDYVAHAYGPDSREVEEMAVAEDMLLSQLLNSVREKVPGGLNSTVVVLTADHGGPNSPDVLKAAKVDSGRLDNKAVAEKVEAKLTEKYGKADGKGWVLFYFDMNLYLNRHWIRSRGINPDEIEQMAKRTLLEMTGISYVMTRTEAQAGKFPPGLLGMQARHTYREDRSGDLFVLPKVFYSTSSDPIDHITGYAYDRTVPLAFAGFGIKPGVYAQEARIVDIAPTLTFLLGTMPPALNEGRVLSEILNTEAIRSPR